MPCDSWYDVMDAAGNGASDQFSGLTDSLSEQQHGQLPIKQLPQLRRSSSSGSGDALIPLDADFHVLPSTGALAAMGMTTGAALQPRQLWSPPCEQTYSNRSSMDHHASRVSMDNHSSRSSMDIHNSRSSMDGPHSYARNSFEGPRQPPQRQSFDGPRAQRSRSSLDMQAPLLNFSSGSNASQQHRSAPSNVVNMEGGVGPSGQDQHHQESAQPGKAPSARKGQGYRRLWQAVTKVQRGQRLGDATSDWSECTVEDLVRILHALPASASAVQAAGPGLAYLDSRAAAALFKGLAKSGLGHRAVELFDYLRSLDEHNELAPLCDIYTYTTMISQCGSHHQLRRALELVAEMRGRAIALNVHTYSALLNVCLKSNELDLALDIREQMLAEGCMPNLVTFNTLCDIYGKTGRWADALAVLDTLQEQGIQPEVRTYNAIMAACNMSGRHAEAVSVYERLLSNGLEPGAATFNAAITAYTKSGQLDAALEMLALMGSKGFERGGAAYSAVLSACEAPGRWDLALELLAQMQREGVRPSTACFTSAINACLQGNQPQRAEQLFERMHTICKPDAATFNCLVVVYCRLGKVREAQNMVEVMMRAGQSVELPTYSAVICVLWCSGVVPLQRHALQLFDRACKQGLYRLQVREQTAHEDCVDIQLPCAPPHTTLIALTQLLRELRDRCARDGPVLLKRRVVLRVPVQAKDAAVQERTLTAALQALGAPFTTSSGTCTSSTSPRSATNGSATPPTTHTTQMDELRLCAESQALGPWLAGPAPTLALGGLQSAPPEALVRLDGMALAQQDMARELRCRQAMGTVQAFEMGCFVDSQAMPQALLLQRSEGVQTMLAAATQLGIRREAAHDAVLLHDRVMSSGHLPQPDAAMGSLVAAACLAIAGQQAKPNDGQDLVVGVSHAMRVPLDALTMWVGHVRQLLGGNTASISALRVLRLYMERLGCESEDPSAIHCVCGGALSAMDRVVASPLSIGCPPSITATAVMYAARVAAGLLPAWPQALLSLVGYHCPSDLLQPYVDAAMQLLAMQQ